MALSSSYPSLTSTGLLFFEVKTPENISFKENKFEDYPDFSEPCCSKEAKSKSFYICWGFWLSYSAKKSMSSYFLLCWAFSGFYWKFVSNKSSLKKSISPLLEF